MNDADRLREILGVTDPVTNDGYVPDLQRRERVLRAILATPRTNQPSRRPARRFEIRGRGWVAVTAVVLVAIAGTVAAIALPRSASPAWATPAPLTVQQQAAPQPAAPRLHALAATIANRPATTPAGTARDHLMIRSWSLNSDIAGTTVTSVVIPTETETWRDPDNAGSQIVRYLEPQAPTRSQLDAWHEQGSPGVDNPVTTDRFGAGEFPAVWTDRPPIQPAQLRPWLSSTRQGTDPAIAIVTGITDLLHERALSAAENAAVLGLLADLPGLQYTGAVTDRAERAGDAYTVTIDAPDDAGPGLPTTYTFIVDPAGGRVLAQERVLATDVGRLNIKAPAVTGYDTYLLSELVAQ
jgi:hypothetical protein